MYHQLNQPRNGETPFIIIIDHRSSIIIITIIIIIIITSSIGGSAAASFVLHFKSVIKLGRVTLTQELSLILQMLTTLPQARDIQVLLHCKERDRREGWRKKDIRKEREKREEGNKENDHHHYYYIIYLHLILKLVAIIQLLHSSLHHSLITQY